MPEPLTIETRFEKDEDGLWSYFASYGSIKRTESGFPDLEACKAKASVAFADRDSTSAMLRERLRVKAKETLAILDRTDLAAVRKEVFLFVLTFGNGDTEYLDESELRTLDLPAHYHPDQLFQTLCARLKAAEASKKEKEVHNV